MEPLSLSQLNTLVSEVVRESFTDSYWMAAEITDVRINASGHCYLEFIEKNPHTHLMTARAKGNIWNQTFRMLGPYFEQSTGQAFVSGIKILVKVTVDFHELYGYALTVHDIDPAYTMGDLQRQRQLILDQLEEEGVKDMNKELDFPLLPQRIAVITSASAAGYEDFIEQLRHNSEGFVFYPRLFPAIMQGEKTETSIIEALNDISRHSDMFDLVAIIRGGGSTSDLQAYDSYLLATNCAQFPLPIVVGIGHERDETVLDFIANQRAKTPTAAATLLIERMRDAVSELSDSMQRIILGSEKKLNDHKIALQNTALRLNTRSSSLLPQYGRELELTGTQLRHSLLKLIDNKKHQLEVHTQFIRLSSPLHLLSKGYSITLKEGKAVKNSKQLQPGDLLETLLADGSVKSKVYN